MVESIQHLQHGDGRPLAGAAEESKGALLRQNAPRHGKAEADGAVERFVRIEQVVRDADAFFNASAGADCIPCAAARGIQRCEQRAAGDAQGTNGTTP